MKWKCFLIVVLLLQSVSARDIVLIDFDTDLLDSTVVWLERLEEKGLIATFVFPPDKAIAVAHGVPTGWLGGQADNYSIYLPEDIAKNSS